MGVSPIGSLPDSSHFPGTKSIIRKGINSLGTLEMFFLPDDFSESKIPHQLQDFLAFLGWNMTYEKKPRVGSRINSNLVVKF